MWERFLARGTSLPNFVQFARAVLKMLQNCGGVMGVSCTFCGHFALSEGTSLGQKEIGSFIFSEILYGGSWDGMRSPHNILGQSEVI